MCPPAHRLSYKCLCLPDVREFSSESEISKRSDVDFRFEPGGRLSLSGCSRNFAKRLAILTMFLYISQ